MKIKSSNINKSLEFCFLNSLKNNDLWMGLVELLYMYDRVDGIKLNWSNRYIEIGNDLIGEKNNFYSFCG